MLAKFRLKNEAGWLKELVGNPTFWENVGLLEEFIASWVDKLTLWGNWLGRVLFCEVWPILNKLIPLCGLEVEAWPLVRRVPLFAAIIVLFICGLNMFVVGALFAELKILCDGLASPGVGEPPKIGLETWDGRVAGTFAWICWGCICWKGNCCIFKCACIGGGGASCGDGGGGFRTGGDDRTGDCYFPKMLPLLLPFWGDVPCLKNMRFILYFLAKVLLKSIHIT